MNETMSADQMSTVIIVGGGPIGLTMALALERAGIDSVVLEQRSGVVTEEGADLVLLPMALRALSQFDVLEDIRRVSVRLRNLPCLDHYGRADGEMTWFQKYQENFGQYPLITPRSELLRILFEKLRASAKAKVHANKKVLSVDLIPGSATVTCNDGSRYVGKIVVGADGAHSTIRQYMRTLALEATDRKIGSTKGGVNPKDPFLAAYNTLWFRFPRSIYETLTPGTAFEIHGKEVAVQLFVGKENVAVAAYKKRCILSSCKMRYTEEDRDAFIESCNDLALIPGGRLVLGQAYEARLRSGMVALEVGVLDYWSHGRIVLVGDAAHKFTPNTGSGFNYGIIDVVALANELHGLVSKQGADLCTKSRLNPIFSKDELCGAFGRYQAARVCIVKSANRISSQLMDLCVRPTALHWFGSKIISLRSLQAFFSRQDALVLAKSPKFDFIEGEEPFSGQVPWAT